MSTRLSADGDRRPRRSRLFDPILPGDRSRPCPCLPRRVWQSSRATCSPGSILVSSERARFLLVTQPAGFERFMRAVGTAAERLEIPPTPTEPPDFDALVATAEQFGLEILGPPGIPG